MLIVRLHPSGDSEAGRGMVTLLSSHQMARVALGCFLIQGCAPSMVRGQEALRLEPSLRVSQVYDSNLLFAADGRQDDFITRISPGIDTAYRSAVLSFTGDYSLDAERFAEHSSLTGVNAHRTRVSTTYKPAPRFELAAEGAFMRTQFPGELAPGTGLVLRPAPALRFFVHPSAARQLDQRTSADVDYSFTDDQIVGGMRFRAQSTSIRLQRRESERTTASIRYELDRFDFNTGTASTSNMLTLGWTRSMTRDLSIALTGGPRIDNRRLEPELTAGMQARVRTGDLSLAYSRSRAPVIGFTSAAQTDTLRGSVAFMPWRHARVQVMPSVYRVVTGDRHARISRLGVEVSPVTSLRAEYDVSLQNGDIYSTALPSAFSRHVLSITFIRSRPPRLGK
jgi:hypothetical protein